MYELWVKHTGLPIPDMSASIDIDHDAKKVTMNLGHFDSGLVINAARNVELKHAPIRLIDNESHKTWGPAVIPGRYDLYLRFNGFYCRAYIVEKMRDGGLTVSLQALKPM